MKPPRRLAALLPALAVVCLASWGAARASDAPASPQGNASPAASAQPFDPVAATEAYLAQLSPEERARSDAYFEGGYWLLLWDFVAAAMLAWLFLGTRLSTGLRDTAERLVRWRWLQTAIYGAGYLVISTLVMLPWTAYETYFREHQYAMSNQDLAGWLGDQAKELAVGLILGTLAITAVYAVLRKAPRTWWLWGALVTIAFIVFAAAIAPVYIEPVFNEFRPLDESPLKQEILSMARANGVPATDVYEFDASRQSKRMSAHVSGLFGTAQISLNDTLLDGRSDEEILAVVAHEMGHYVLNHTYKTIIAFGLIIIGGFAFLGWSFDKVRTGCGAVWGIRGIGDVAGLPLLIFLFTVYSFVMTPVQNTLIRTMENEADSYSVVASRQPDGFAQAALDASEYRKMRPGRLEEWILYDHPSGWNRIHRGMVWKAEHINDPDILAYDEAHPDTPGL